MRYQFDGKGFWQCIHGVIGTVNSVCPKCEEEKVFIPDAGYNACEFCGICSFAHKHPVGTLPKDFERIDDSWDKRKWCKDDCPCKQQRITCYCAEYGEKDCTVLICDCCRPVSEKEEVYECWKEDCPGKGTNHYHSIGAWDSAPSEPPKNDDDEVCAACDADILTNLDGGSLHTCSSEPFSAQPSPTPSIAEAKALIESEWEKELMTAENATLIKPERLINQIKRLLTARDLLSRHEQREEDMETIMKFDPYEKSGGVFHAQNCCYKAHRLDLNEQILNSKTHEIK